ncbi:DUF1149 family protein [Companilactobacillus ginsenosidimutans]|uniref:Uncharacterized protein n=1 Tax=Companilactobacillus ginsenosidimutans TaxID=1007676 RepID=A0A0H4R346_9LACO|nr:DUF1149 family protein [Companilactobacillus ginsenosidimutans]AKP68195.1 hypothetical protein ABM34_12060 [Companilactobacillus ginsenosidimutans]
MKTNKGPISVQQYHYDIADPDEEVKSEIQIALEHPELHDEDGKKVEETDGRIYQVVVPFDIHPGNSPFKISGMITQIVQLMDFHGHREDLTSKEVQQISREAIEYIETITYQVTAITLNHGVSLDFSAADSLEPNQHVKDLQEKKNKKD